jgi:hypothetical protein
MDNEEFDKYLEERYYDQIKWYDRKSVWNHKAYDKFQWSAIILASLTPVLVLVGEDWSKWIAASVAVLVAIITGALKTFKYQENWINYRTTSEILRKEIYYFDANIQGYENFTDIEEKRSMFIQRVENLISRENTSWVTVQEKEKPKKG